MRHVSNVTPSAAGAHVIEATLELEQSLDPAAVGAAVIVELCGHSEHEGACRWPHNCAIDTARTPARFRTLFVAEEGEVGEVGERIERVLRGGSTWRVVALGARPVAEHEQALAERLRTGPRATA